MKTEPSASACLRKTEWWRPKILVSGTRCGELLECGQGFERGTGLLTLHGLFNPLFADLFEVGWVLCGIIGLRFTMVHNLRESYLIEWPRFVAWIERLKEYRILCRTYRVMIRIYFY